MFELCKSTYAWTSFNKYPSSFLPVFGNTGCEQFIICIDQHYFIYRTRASMDFDIHGGFWDQPQVDTEGQLKFCGSQTLCMDFLSQGVWGLLGSLSPVLFTDQLYLLKVRPLW